MPGFLQAVFLDKCGKVMKNQTSIKRNLVFMYLLHGSNCIIPLITLPYLVRVLGPEKFGLLAFAQGVVHYFIILTDYGFNLSATRQIAIKKGSNERVSEIFCATMLLKLVFMFGSLILITVIISLVPKFRHDWVVYMLTFLSVPGSVIFPIWYFQGMEQMRYISIITIAANFLSAVAIFVFVHQESDYNIAAAIQSGGLLVVGLVTAKMTWEVTPIQLKVPTVYFLKETLKDGWHIFVSTASISLYTTSTIVILGLFTNNVTVGYFSAADKLVSAVKNLVGPVSQTIYPRINSLAQNSHEIALSFIRRCLLFISISSLLVSCLLFVSAPFLVQVLLGEKFIFSVLLVRWMAFLPFIISLSNILGIQTMLTFGMKSEFMKILVASGLVNIILLIPLALFLGAEGAAIAVTFTEIVVTVSMALVLRNRGYNLFKGNNLTYEC